MDAEYFPPKEDVILQNEAPTDLYILVSGTVDLILYTDGHHRVVRKATAGDVFGEIGVLCYRPQPFTVRTTEVSQILRLDRTSLMNIIQANIEDGRIMMNNLNMKLQDPESRGFLCQNTDLGFFVSKWLDGGTKGACSETGCQYSSHCDATEREAEDIGVDELEATDKSETGHFRNSPAHKVDINSCTKYGQTALHAAVRSGQVEMVKILLEGGANVNKQDSRGRTAKALAEQQGNKSIYDLVLSYENRRIANEHRIDFPETETVTDTRNNLGKQNEKPKFSDSHTRKASASSYVSSFVNDTGNKFIQKRVTIHMQLQNRSVSQRRLGKLIILPDSIEELLRFAGEKFGGYKFERVINCENAEIDDIDAIRDGDHLFLLQTDTESLG